MARSDFNNVRNTKQRDPYSDLDLSFTIHPTLNDIIPLIDLDAIKNAVKNLVLTNYFERPFQPSLGGNVRALLFEPVDNLTAIALKEEITELIVKHEPRVDKVEVTVKDQRDTNRYHITVGFRVKNANSTVDDLNFYLTRIR
jgi:phage baseplate assembly protein W